MNGWKKISRERVGTIGGSDEFASPGQAQCPIGAGEGTEILSWYGISSY